METAPTTSDAENASATASATAGAPSLQAGDAVTTAYGKGTVLRIVQEDERAAARCAISLIEWTMAQGQSPVLFMALQEKSLRRFEAPVDVVAEMFDRCAKKKEEAADIFKSHDFETAKNLYADILGMINGLSDLLPAGATVSDVVRARIIELIIPCQNNIALCCLHLKEYQGCIESAAAAATLVDSCMASPDLGRVLATRNMNEERLLVDYKKKSHLYIGKACLAKADYERAIEELKAGLKIVESVPDRKTDVKSFSDLIDMCRRSLKKQEEKEKKTWSNVFKKDNMVEPSDESASSSSESRKKAPTITSPLPPASPHYNDDDMYVNDGNDSDDDEVDADDKGADFVAEKFLTNNAPTLLGLAVLGIAGIGIALARKARK